MARQESVSLMRFVVFVLALLALQSAPWLAARAQAQPKDAGVTLRRFAVIASSNDGGPGRMRLRFAESDALAMADVLRHLGGLHSEDLVLLPGTRRASLQAAFERLRAAIAKVPPGGLRREIFVYYSGHSDETGLLLGKDRVLYAELRRWLESTGADVRIAILDSCASGALIRRRGGTRRPPFLSDASSAARGHAFLTASSENEAAQESDRVGAAFFTHFLVSALRGAADANRDGRVTLAEAYQFAYDETLGRTAQTAAGAQHPAYDIQLAGSGDLVLTDLRASSASLVLERDVSGRAYVRDAAGKLVVELRKDGSRAVGLGVAPGDYRVVLDQDGRKFDAAVRVQDGKPASLARAAFVPSPALPATARGAPVSPSSPSSEADTWIGEGSLIGRTRQLGGYAGIGFRYTEVGGADAFTAELEGAVLLDRRFSIGFTVAGGLSGRTPVDATTLSFGYAGVVMRHHFVFDSPWSFSVGAIAGGGGVHRKPPDGSDASTSDTQEDAFFLFQPELAGHLDVTRFMRIGVAAGYRWALGADRYEARTLDGFAAGLQTQLGWF
jgi:hypothetical protein